MECLSKRISHTRKGGPIIPIGDLKKIWTKKELNGIVGVSLSDRQFQFVQNNLLRTISFLSYLKVSNLGLLILRWIEDREELDQQLHEVESSFFGLEMSELQQELFSSARRYFTALVLTEGEDASLQDGQVMPLIGEKSLGYGENGHVTGHEIPPGHLIRKKTANSERVSVAKKTLYKPRKENEILILKKLRQSLLDKIDNNIRICTCITMVTEGDNVHSLSEQSELDLEEYLRKMKASEKIDETRLLDSIGQIKGIASATDFLHNTLSNGEGTCFCHMDIKPKNILVFGDSSTVGTWKLTDFGISSMSHQRSRRTEGGPREEDQNRGQRITVTVGTSAKQLPGKYQPPEVNTYYSGRRTVGTVGRGSDVWALACVFSEVLAANLNQLPKLTEDMEEHSEFFYEETKSPLCFCRAKMIHCWRHKLNSSLGEWLKVQREENPRVKFCKKLIVDMMELKRMRRLKPSQLVQRIQNFRDGGGNNQASISR